jgi:hypothetical protein
MSNEGGSLTQADMATLTAESIDFNKIWESMTEDERLAYGNKVENLMKDFSDAVDIAKKDFEKAGNAARDFMTSDMAAAFKSKLD